MAGYVLGFEQVDATMLALVGGKGANLGELARIGGAVRVPDGFCVTTDAYAEAVGGNAELATLLERLSQLGADDADAVAALGARIRATVEATPVPPGAADEIGGRLADLGEQGAYAVRSSATAEDLPTASFAGQQDTYLNVRGKDAVLRHVRRCWASLFTDRAIAYRLRRGVDQRGVQLAVVVQRMVLPEVAGVLFTADPITSDRRTVAVEAAAGLGEAMVSGLVNADAYQVRDGRIVSRSVSADAGRQGVQKLPDADVLALAAIGRTVEAHFGRPQDIEWAYADGAFHVLQSRPITTLFPVPGPRDGRNHVYMSFGHQQMMTDAMTPLGLSVFQLQLGDAPLVEAGGRFYIDMAADLAAPVGRRIALAALARTDPLVVSAVRGLLRRAEFVQGLARDGQRYFRMNAGYFSWRLPVEVVKLHLSNDPTRVPALIAGHDAGLDDLRRRLGSRSGVELLDAVRDDLGRQLGKVVTDPRSMAVVFVGLYASSWIDKHMKKWLGVQSAGDALAQLVTNNVTSRMGPALLDVADTVRARPAVLAALPTLTDAAFFAELSALDGGDAVARSLRGFLAEYGMRCPGEIDITRPRWSEQPSALVPLILATTRTLGPDARATRTERRRRAEETRDDLIGRLERLPGGRRKARRTVAMISRMQNFAGYREYPKYLMMRHYWLVKQAMLGEAAALVEKGALRRPDDVHHLSFDEFREAVRTGRVDHDLIARRRAEFETWARLTPPRVITSAGEVPPAGYEGARVPAGALAGIAASAGTVEGRARIVATLTEADLDAGDILVTTFTDPSWTPAFLTATALVTEVGGAMTHGAVVAREYGLPAVVGVDGATRRIRDGQRIRVNGTDGYVELVD